MCAHFDSEFSGSVTNHYHVLIDTTTFGKETLKRNQNFPMPFVFTNINILFATATNLETNGDVLESSNWRLNLKAPQIKFTHRQSESTYNNVEISNAKQVNMNQKPCAKMLVVAQKTIENHRPPSKQVQSNFVSSETIRRVENILSGSHSGAFVKLWISVLVDTEN